MQLSQKQKTFSQFFATFLKLILSFNNFETKYDRHRFCISEIRASENLVRLLSKMSRLRGPFNNQHAKRVEPVLKSASQHLYPIH